MERRAAAGDAEARAALEDARRRLGHDRIVSARITAMPRPMPDGMYDPMPKVFATTGDGVEHELFSYYPDELSFSPDEFVGITVAEARRLKFEKDVRYLRENPGGDEEVRRLGREAMAARTAEAMRAWRQAASDAGLPVAPRAGDVVMVLERNSPWVASPQPWRGYVIETSGRDMPAQVAVRESREILWKVRPTPTRDEAWLTLAMDDEVTVVVAGNWCPKVWRRTLPSDIFRRAKSDLRSGRGT